MEANTNNQKEIEQLWRSILTGEKPPVPMGEIRSFFSKFSSGERCKCCNIPFTEKNVFNFDLWSKRSNVSPHFCKKCEDFAKGHIGGAEVCMTMLFADIRGSTQLGETISPTEFREILNRFYTVATDVLTKNDAWIDKFVGDEAIGLFIPGFAGDNHTSLAIKSAIELLEATGHASSEGPWVPLRIGINTGNVFMGAVGSGSVTDITPLGDNVNIAARLSGESKTGEILISDASYKSPDCKTNSSQKLFQKLEMKESTIELKGKSDAQKVYIGSMCASS